MEQNTVQDEKTHEQNKSQKYLWAYYKHFCSLIYKTPKGSTFDSIKQMFDTMTLTQWIAFCRSVGILGYKYEGKSMSGQELSRVFLQFEEKNKRFTFEDFKEAIHHVMLSMFRDDEKKGEQLLGIHTEKAHQRKLRSFGLMVSSQKSFITPKIHSSIHEEPTKVQKSSVLSSGTSIIHRKRERKYYKNNEQRQQCKLLHKLTVQNLKKVKISCQMQGKLKKLVKGNDSYLKQEIKGNGYMARLEARMNSVGKRNGF